MINLILNLLGKLPYRTKFDTSLSDELKNWWYWEKNHHDKCLCGGSINFYGLGNHHWVVQCSVCEYIANED